MTIIKRFVVLANSVKHEPGRCIAGREIVQNPLEKLQFGSWVRPVSQSGEGELQPHQFRLENGDTPKLFDVVEVALSAPGNDPAQPENWAIEEGQPWRRAGTLARQDVQAAAESPKDLWVAHGAPTDRIPEALIQHSPPQQSLYWLHLPAARTVPDYRKRRQFRLAFEYRSLGYHLKVTDPEATSRIAAQINGNSELLVKNAMACISLAPPFRGDRYKLVAALSW